MLRDHCRKGPTQWPAPGPISLSVAPVWHPKLSVLRDQSGQTHPEDLRAHQEGREGPSALLLGPLPPSPCAQGGLGHSATPQLPWPDRVAQGTDIHSLAGLQLPCWQTESPGRGCAGGCAGEQAPRRLCGCTCRDRGQHRPLLPSSRDWKAALPLSAEGRPSCPCSSLSCHPLGSWPRPHVCLSVWSSIPYKDTWH